MVVEFNPDRDRSKRRGDDQARPSSEPQRPRCPTRQGRALTKFVAIIWMAADSEVEAMLGEEDKLAMHEKVFAMKATGTLANCASNIRLFFCKSAVFHVECSWCTAADWEHLQLGYSCVTWTESSLSCQLLRRHFVYRAPTWHPLLKSQWISRANDGQPLG